MSIAAGLINQPGRLEALGSCGLSWRDEAKWFGVSMPVKAHRLFEIAGLLLLPTAACGHGRQPPTEGATKVTPSGSGLSLQAFTARREHRMLAVDINGDGKVSRAEFLGSAKSGRGYFARRFGRLDRDGNGSINRPEILATMARRFKRLDADGKDVLTPAERSEAKTKADASNPDL